MGWSLIQLIPSLGRGKKEHILKAQLGSLNYQFPQARDLENWDPDQATMLKMKAERGQCQTCK